MDLSPRNENILQMTERKKESKKKKTPQYLLITRDGPWEVVDRTFLENKKFRKYWWRRDLLLPKSPSGNLLLDIESWYSITPRDLADRISAGITRGFGRHVSALDLFSGVGGNTISLLKHFHAVTSVEIDYSKIRYLRHNVSECLSTHIDHTIIHSDVFAEDLKEKLEKASTYDVLVASPPWGGVDYTSKGPLDLLEECRVTDLEIMYGSVVPTRIYILPKNISRILLTSVYGCAVYSGDSDGKKVATIAVMGDTTKYVHSRSSCLNPSRQVSD